MSIAGAAELLNEQKQSEMVLLCIRLTVRVSANSANKNLPTKLSAAIKKCFLHNENNFIFDEAGEKLEWKVQVQCSKIITEIIHHQP